jgi:hypothetical protein
MNGGVKDMLFSKETTGGVFTVDHLQPKFTIKDMPEKELEKSPSNGWYPSARNVMNLDIIEEMDSRFIKTVAA